MTDMNDNVRIDANFLERGLFGLDRQCKARSVKSADGRFEIVSSASSVPVDVDHAVLIYLLHMSQNNVNEDGKWKPVLTPTFYEILQGIGKDRPGKADYDRAAESLYRYSTARIEFIDSFYERDASNKQVRVSKSFHVLSYEIGEDGRPIIALDEIFLRQLRKTKFYKTLSFSVYKRLNQPLARRLYELVEKWTMGNQKTWTIDAKALGEKLTMAERAASQIVRRIEVAVGKINDATGGMITFNAKKIKHGEFSLSFAVSKRNPKKLDEAGGRQAKAPAVSKPRQTTKAKSKPIPATTISHTVLSALPPSSRDDKTFITALAALPEADAMAVIEYVKANAKKGFGPLMSHLIRNKGLANLAAEIGTRVKTVNEVLFRDVIKARQAINDDDFRRFCKHRKVDPDEAIAWAEENAPDLLVPLSE
jgi:hypothetical protein